VFWKLYVFSLVVLCIRSLSIQVDESGDFDSLLANSNFNGAQQPNNQKLSSHSDGNSVGMNAGSIKVPQNAGIGDGSSFDGSVKMGKDDSEMESLQGKSTSQLVSLAKHKRAQISLLEAERDKAQSALESAKQALELSRRRVAAYEDARESEAALKRHAEQKLALVELELPELDSQLSSLQEELKVMSSQSELLQTSYKALLEEHAELMIQLQSHPALERWLERHVGSLSPVVRGALRKTSSALLYPVVTSVKTAGSVNSKLSAEVDHVLHVQKDSLSVSSDRSGRLSDVTAGVWFYTALLFPLVLTLAALQKIWMNVRRWRSTHVILCFCVYLSILSCSCWISCFALHPHDIFSVLALQYPTLLSNTVAIHALLFLALISAQWMEFIKSRDAQHFSQFLAVFCLVLHFYFHAWKPVMLDQEPSFGTASWLLYAMVFSLIVTEKSVAIWPSVTLLPSARADIRRSQNTIQLSFPQVASSLSSSKRA